MQIEVKATLFPEVKLIVPPCWHDRRGTFQESYNERDWVTFFDPKVHFVQENFSVSQKQVLRGVHYQLVKPQAKLIRVVAGEIYDVVVDMRRHSATLGHSFAMILNAEQGQQLWVPEGFAHGFFVLSQSARVLYKTTQYWSVEHERTLLWNDPTLKIDWPIQGAPVLSDKDQRGVLFTDAELFE